MQETEEQVLVDKVISIVSNRITLILGDVIRNKSGNFTDVNNELKECIELIYTLNQLKNNGYCIKEIVVNTETLLEKFNKKYNNDTQS